MEETETHYWQERTCPHVEPREACDPCRLGGQAPRWYGFLLVQTMQRKLMIARITPMAYKSCEARWEAEKDLRGLFLTLERVKKAARGEQRATLTRRPDCPTLIADMPLWPVLLNLWGLHPDFPPCNRTPEERRKLRQRDEAN